VIFKDKGNIVRKEIDWKYSCQISSTLFKCTS